MPNRLIERNEAILLSVVAVFALLWMAVFVPYFMKALWFRAQVPLVQFMIFEFGLMLMLIVFFGVPIQYMYFKLKRSVGSKTKLFIGATKLGLSLWAANKLIFDAIEPPFVVSPAGQIILDNPEALTATSVDAMLGWVGQQIGFAGYSLYLFVYVIFPVLALTVIILAFTWKKVIKIFGA